MGECNFPILAFFYLPILICKQKNLNLDVYCSALLSFSFIGCQTKHLNDDDMLIRFSHRFTALLKRHDISSRTPSTSACSLQPHKMVLIVPQDVIMGKGKIAAQCAHAAVQAFKNASPFHRKIWELSNQQKIILKCDDTMQLLDIRKRAEASNLTTALIRDAGRTQVKAGTCTVLGIGPASSDRIDLITGHLKLL